jgi:parvulin-like peptidyl-prolyl isomerase
MGIRCGARARNKAALLFVGLSVSSGLVAGCGAKPVATVNGQNLTDTEFYKLCESATQVNPQAGSVGTQVLSQWIQNTLLAQEAKNKSVYPSEKDLDARLDAFRKQAQFAGFNLDEQLRQRGMTPEAFKRELLNAMVSENVLFQGVNVSDAEARAEFEKRKDSFSQPEQVKISQVTLDTDAKMKQARDDLGANTDFGLVATSYSKDPFKDNRGQVPMPLGRQVPPGGPVDQKIVDAAFKLKPGQVSEPVKVGANWVIVRLDDKIEKKIPQFEDVKELIRASMREQKAQQGGKVQQARTALMEMSRKAKILVHRPEYQAILAQFQAPAPSGPGTASGPGALQPAPPPPPPGG